MQFEFKNRSTFFCKALLGHIHGKISLSKKLISIRNISPDQTWLEKKFNLASGRLVRNLQAEQDPGAGKAGDVVVMVVVVEIRGEYRR